MNWKNFHESEIVNPTFDDCPANTWAELPEEIKRNLIPVIDLAQFIRTKLKLPLRINSTWRPHDKGSAHASGKAADIALLPKNYVFVEWGHEVFDIFMDKAIVEILREKGINKQVRIFWEWSGIKNNGWLHIDVNFKKWGSKPELWVGFPVWKKGKKNMKYRKYSGKAPWEMAAIKNPILLEAA